MARGAHRSDPPAPGGVHASLLDQMRLSLLAEFGAMAIYGHLARRTRDALPEPAARAAIFRIERQVNRKVFRRRALPLEQSVARVKALSEAYGWLRKHTALDVWHVAAAWCLGVNRFVSFDERQIELAEDAGLVLA